LDKKEQKQKKNTNQTTKTKINKYTNKNENNDKNNTYNHPKITNQTHTSQNSGTIKTSRYIHIQTPTVIILKYIISKNKHKSQKPTQKTPTYNTNSYLPNTLKLHIENNINISTNKMIEIITTKSYLLHNIYLSFQTNGNPNTIVRNKIMPQANKKLPKSTQNYHNKKALLKCGDIESNPGPRHNLLLNHPQIHHERQQMYFYNKTTQIKPEYNHIFEIFEPYLKNTQTNNMYLHLT
jgi:hypothetical protein